ncbi:homeobox protein not2-like [Megalops cyprinoides]|uniref:homeobox protein not2-like n=1 Tax=Megalops cyprinoides TaxID=118141 RepID=UPI00186500B9|nr:homeobox protein not2-like [Megalops cyprinoides]
MDTAFFNRPSYASPMNYCYAARDGQPILHMKHPGTSGTQKCSFSIEAILSTSPREPVQHRVETHHGPTFSAPPALPLWLPAGYSAPSSPGSYPHHYMGYQQSDIHHQALYNEGFSGPCGKLMSRRNYVRRTCRRIRTIFTDEQLKKLEEVFSKQRYMTGTEKVLLASALRLSETQVKVWFQNRRTRWRKTQEDKASSSPQSNELRIPSPTEGDQFNTVEEEDSWSS